MNIFIKIKKDRMFKILNFQMGTDIYNLKIVIDSREYEYINDI